MKKLICGIVFLVFCAVTYAQNPEWLNYTNGDKVFALVNADNNLWIGTDGGLVKLNKLTDDLIFYNRANANLPDNHIGCLAMDSTGYFWIGTLNGGIGKFDGNMCEVFNTANSGLPYDQWNTVIAADPGGNVWIGSGAYLTKFDGALWKTYETGNPLSAYIAIHDIKFDKKENMWIGASWGLGKFAEDSLSQGHAGIKEDIYSLAVDKSDTLWIGTNGKGLMKFNGQNFIVFDTTNSDIPGNIIYDIKFDAKENLWLATEHGAAQFDGVNWKTYNKHNSPLTEDVIFSLEIDTDGVIWIGTFKNGFYKFDGKDWRNYKPGNSGLLNNVVSSFALDTNGNRWITCYGEYNYQMVKFDGFRWEYYDSTNFEYLDSYFYRAYSGSTRKIWKGSGVIISYHSSTKWEAHNINSPHRGSNIKEDKQGNIWEASSQGLWKFDGMNWTVYNSDNSPLPTNSIAKIAFDHHDNLLLSTFPVIKFIDGFWTIVSGGELLKFDGTNWETIYVCQPLEHYVSTIEIDSSKQIWIGIMDVTKIGKEYGAGLIKIIGTQLTSYNIYNSELPGNSIVNLCLDKDENLWIGTYAGGLAKFDRNDQWKIYNLKNSGLPGNNVELIEIDAMNNKWLGVQFSGLSVFREGGVILTGIQQNNFGQPISFSLEQNYPNPFNPQTTISYQLLVFSKVSLKIYDVLGKDVRTLVNENKSAGYHSVVWNGTDNSGRKVSSGVYFYQLKSGDNFSQTKKLLLLK